MSSGPIPNSLNPNSVTGREKTHIHQNMARKYPTEEAYLVKNKYFVPKSEKLIMPAKTPNEASPKPVMTASSRVSMGSRRNKLNMAVRRAMPKIPQRNANSAPTTKEPRRVLCTGGA